MSFLREFIAFLRVRKKYWLMPVFVVMFLLGGLSRADQGIGDCALYLHAVLMPLRILGISAFYHDSAAALVVDGASLPRRRRSASRAASTMRGFPPAAIRYCLEAGRHRKRPISTTWCSTTSRSSSSSGCSKPIWRSRRAAFSSFRHGDPALAEGKAVPEGLLRQEPQGDRCQTSIGSSGCCSPIIT